MIKFIKDTRKSWHTKRLIKTLKQNKCFIEGDLKGSAVLFHKVLKERLKAQMPSKSLPIDVYAIRMRSASYLNLHVSLEREKVEKRFRVIFGINLE